MTRRNFRHLWAGGLAALIIAAGGCRPPKPAQPLPATIQLSYRLLRETAGGLQAVPQTYPFHTGDKIRLAFRSNVDGYAYVFALGSSGSARVLYPSPNMKTGSNRLTAEQEHIVPGEGWFQFDATPGTEQLIVFVSLHPLDDVGQSISAGRIAATAWDRYVAPYLRRLADITKDITYVSDQPQPVESAPYNRVSCPVRTREDILLHTIQLTHR